MDVKQAQPETTNIDEEEDEMIGDDDLNPMSSTEGLPQVELVCGGTDDSINAGGLNISNLNSPLLAMTDKSDSLLPTMYLPSKTQLS